MIVTVTMNAALDRILTVPNFQRGQRHRASEKLTLAGGKGIIVARALKRLGVPVVATGLVGGRNGRRILEELERGGGPQRLRPDRGRVADVDGGHRPDLGRVHGDHRVGPARRSRRSSRSCGRRSTTCRAAPRWSSSPGRCRAGSTTSFYAEMIRELNRRGVLDGARHRGRAAAARASRPSPSSSSPNQLEAESLVGPGVLGRGGLRRWRSTRSARWARATSWSRTSTACFAHLRARRSAAGRSATAPSRRTSRPSRRSGRLASCSPAFIAARLETRTARGGAAPRRRRRAPRRRSMVGAGQFELRASVGRSFRDVPRSTELESATAH